MEGGKVEMGFNQGRLARGAFQGVNKDRTVGSTQLSWGTEARGNAKVQKDGTLE